MKVYVIIVLLIVGFALGGTVVAQTTPPDPPPGCDDPLPACDPYPAPSPVPTSVRVFGLGAQTVSVIRSFGLLAFPVVLLLVAAVYFLKNSMEAR